jgi:GT2 family glycosyltransferase/ADP-heptose:LPS heptosyltransferase
MNENQKRAVRQRLIRQAKKQSETTPFANRYGMTPKQIHAALTKKQQNNKRDIKTSNVIRNRNVRPEKAVRASSNKSPSTLMQVPSVSVQNAIKFPTPDWFTSTTEKIDVSVIIPCYKSADVLKELIEKWSLDEGLNVEIIYVDDNCPLDSKQHIVQLWKNRKSELKRPVGKILYSPVNQGFATACNTGGYNASGEYLIFLNADTVVTPGWIRPMVRLLRKKEVGIVGNLQIKHGGIWKDTIDSAGSEWSWDVNSFEHIGRHIYNGTRIKRPFAIDNAPADLFETKEREMVTGCCIAMRKDVFLDVGGFNPNYRIGYWEDSEICMSVREKGYKIMYQPNSRIYHKGHHSQSGGHKYASHNINYFRNKWIATGRLDKLVGDKRKEIPEVNKIIIKRTTAHGDVLVATAVASALKKKYPDCHISLQTVCNDIGVENPHIDKVVTSYELSEKGFDLYFNLDMAYEFRPQTNILEAYADVVGVNVKDCELYLPTKKVESLPEEYIVFHSGNTKWAGRDWSSVKFEILANKLRSEGHKVVCVGRTGDHKVTSDLDLMGKTSIKELAYVIKNAKLFVGIDSFPMHVAQTFQTPGVCFFGSVDPKSRLIGDCITPVVAAGLGCLGCHHRQPVPCTSLIHCETEMLDCINMVSVENMLSKIKERLQ